jgi:hypothetical protein
MDKLPTTIEELAAMLYTHMASKEDIKRVEQIQKDMLEELNATHEDVRYVRNTMNMLVTSDAAHEAAIESLRKRVERVERKVGIVK